MSSGPLEGVRVVELAGIGPAPFAGMVLGDLGADVTRIDRPGAGPTPGDLANRGKRSIRIDLKHASGRELALSIIERSDLLIEGLRPGVCERLGLGPQECFERNPALVYGRVTGWGQVGPLAPMAGHDINYIALAGALAHMGRAGDKPTPPLNLVGDFGGGGMLLLVGVLAALNDSARTGIGQVVDAAMVDGAALQMNMIHDLESRGLWTDERGSNALDTGAPFYDTYETSDGRFVAVGAIEAQFFETLIEGLGLAADEIPPQQDMERWPELRTRLTSVFLTKTRDEWESVFGDSDACVTPVLTMQEAAEHPHNRYRSTFVEIEGRRAPGVARRFSRTPTTSGAIPTTGGDSKKILIELGLDDSAIGSLLEEGIVE